MKKIEKILIANRGEIACRVIRTARTMNIATVAVYSDADRDALHVRMADEAVHIGAAPAAESYLVIDKIIAAAKDTGADAIHPGYGFLSENPAFVRACEAADITFIGPSAEAMEAMGLKDAAKALMSEAGVPVTPGYQGENQDPDFLAEQAAEIGYPVLIKAVAGGGGKGMRKVEDADEFKAALASCQREAASSFGNDHVLIEKYITSPRHIEVQIFGDSHGNVIHLFERDCSLQRRHQKVIEEAPAPGMTDDVREAMTQAAIRAAEAVDYVGAGTVEFIVDGSGSLRTDGFWFMEMNTRLQVEHPVTEEITGLDLVELQIRVARGEMLPKQDEITMSGHAIEVRLYAEDPANDFLPSTGRIRLLKAAGDRANHDGSGFRIDTGFDSGSTFPIFYDPMIAKVIGFGDTRNEAIYQTRRGIEQTQIYPIKTNAAFLEYCLDEPDFFSGHVSTNFISKHWESLKPYEIGSNPKAYALAALRLEQDEFDAYVGDTSSPFEKPSGFRLNGPDQRVYSFQKDGERLQVEIEKSLTNFAQVRVGDEILHFEFPPDNKSTSLPEAFDDYNAWSFKVTSDYVSLMFGSHIGQVERYRPTGDSALTSGNAVTAPMPGKVISVLVAPGEAVTADQPLIILEAMKMEMTLKSPRDGAVAEIGAEAGALVEDGQALVSLKEDE